MMIFLGMKRMVGRRDDMGKKATENRYGVQVGDIFVQHCYFEDFGSYNFYQVTALRGETQVVVRPIKKKCIAFDG